MVRIDGWLREGWEIYKRDWGTFSIAALLVLILGGISATFLLGPMMVGWFMLAFRAMRGQSAGVGDVFSGFQKFLPAFLATLIYVVGLGIQTTLGTMHAALASLYAVIVLPVLHALFFFGVWPLIADREMEIGEVIGTAWNRIQPNLLMFWLCGLLYTIVVLLGLLACCVGAFVTSAVVGLAGAVAYRDLFGLSGATGEGAQADSAPPPQP